MPGDIEIIARTIYAEARGDYNRRDGGLPALIAVGNVIMNRYKLQSWFGKTISEVCLKPWQFSCWNSKDPNYRLLTGEIMDPIFNLCLTVAKNILNDRWPDLTRGSDHYHAISLFPYPRWSQGKIPSLRIGGHLFYQLEQKRR